MRMTYVVMAICMVLSIQDALADDALLNLRDPNNVSPFAPTLKIFGPNDNGANPSAKVPMLPCVASAASPAWTEGRIAPCSVDLLGNLRVSGGGGGGGGTVDQGAPNTIGNAWPTRICDTVECANVNVSNQLEVSLNGTILLPVGASTSALQTAGNSSLTSIATSLDVGLSTRLSDATFTGRFAPAIISTDGIANQTTTAMHGLGFMYNGTTWDRIRGTIANGLLVNISNATLAVTQSGTWNINNISGTVSLPTGAATEVTLGTRVADSTMTNRLPTGSTPADNESNAVTMSRLGVYNYAFDGTAWDRWTGGVSQVGTWDINNISGTISLPTGAATEATLTTRLADATFTGRFTAGTLDADGIANETTTAVHGKCYLYNGTAWDRCRGTVASGLLVNVSNTTFAVTQSGTWNINAVTLITNTVTVQGTKTHNSAASSTNNVGVLPCIATTAAPTYTDGNQVGCSTAVNGATRVIEQNFIATANNSGSCPSGAANFTVAANNASRTWLSIWASPNNTDDVFVKLGATATSGNARISPGQSINFTDGRIYTGQIDALPASGTQAVCLMELN